ncbi:hypothetical protein DVA67_020125 [Solirubrobacter sp. CPCC 204708]|uniref:Uncharacterized protein n=1 Tax=Solirubrobacter deserti TaxID=2282478 RepID=A0ABT4RQ17_9ACTN|nr:hypothetical protein [Solirubrobacter deserti]MBE2318300.1 hypothetical protein [Solirubrobacter deserti]MDA0140639.1 hypothetical protein [Solirubrobacter deserti]
MPELYVALLHMPGAFVYAGTQASSVAEAVAAFGDEVLGIEWLQTFDSLPARGQENEAVQAVLAGLLDAPVVFVEGYDEDEAGDPLDGMRAHLDHWVDEAAERFGEFSVGAYGFVLEMQLGDEVELGWAYGGALTPGAAELFARAADMARFQS